MEYALKLDPEVMQKLGSRLKDRFTTYARDRRINEEQWMRNLRQHLGQYDPEIMQRIDKDRSQAYPKLTRIKVVSMVSRLMSLLFPVGEKNWALNASPSPSLDADALRLALADWAQENPQAQFSMDNLDTIINKYAMKVADRVEKKVDDQLLSLGGSPSVDYVALVRRVVFSAVLYSAGVLKGPMTMTRTKGTVKQLPDGSLQVSNELEYAPFYEFVSLWDYYPDLAAKDFAAMDGQFERHVLSAHQLLKLADRPDFMKDAINKYLRTYPDGNWRRREYEQEMRALGNAQNTQEMGRKYEVISWWGYIKGTDLRAAGEMINDAELTNDFEADVWLVEDTIIKVARCPYPEGTRQYHIFVFEDDEVNLMGSGLPPIMRDSQLGLSTATRMLIDNAAVAAGPQLEINMDMLREDQLITSIQPFQIYYRQDDGVNLNSGTRAVNNVSLDSHISELLQMIELFQGFADKETFLSPATGGEYENAPSEPMRTTAGASMILGNSALPFRDIVRNFDQFTMSVIDSLYQWNKLFDPDPRNKGDLQPIAKGATSLIAKEVRAMALDNLANTLLEEEKVYVDFEEFYKQRLVVRDLPAELLKVPKEVSDGRIAAQQQAQAAQTDQASRLAEVQIKEMAANALKNAAQAQKNIDGAQVAAFNAAVTSLEKGINPDDAKRFSQGAGGGALPAQAGIGAQSDAEVAPTSPGFNQAGAAANGPE